mmetsp:Transcript_64322/g.199160  ORF Transcript_64322/g.199160 Transcript_64322/m.199160 type:complete len:340 (+) Transcript_64322:600-1619(+)
MRSRASLHGRPSSQAWSTWTAGSRSRRPQRRSGRQRCALQTGHWRRSWRSCPFARGLGAASWWWTARRTGSAAGLAATPSAGPRASSARAWGSPRRSNRCKTSPHTSSLPPLRTRELQPLATQVHLEGQAQLLRLGLSARALSCQALGSRWTSCWPALRSLQHSLQVLPRLFQGMSEHPQRRMRALYPSRCCTCGFEAPRVPRCRSRSAGRRTCVCSWRRPAAVWACSRRTLASGTRAGRSSPCIRRRSSACVTGTSWRPRGRPPSCSMPPHSKGGGSPQAAAGCRRRAWISCGAAPPATPSTWPPPRQWKRSRSSPACGADGRATRRSPRGARGRGGP